MEAEDIIHITRRQFGKLAQLLTGKTHKIEVKTQFTCHMVEVEDLNFHHDSAVMLPDYGVSVPQEGTTQEQERVTGLAVLYACYRHARDHPDQSMLTVGHTDRSGSTVYNQTLSELRAENVRSALRGDRDGWVEVCLNKSKVEDYQQILIWLTHSLGWNCDPGGKTNRHDATTHAAVEAFQQQYNDDDRFQNDIDVDGGVGRQTWGAFFDVYMLELQHALGTDAAGLAEAQQGLKFITCEAIGCGEEFPITEDRAENFKSPIDRRVEVLFFDPGEEPVIDCNAPKGACVELYEKKMYCVIPVPVTPLPLPSGVAVHVFLELKFTDPEGVDRTFPGNCPVTVEYTTGQRDAQKTNEKGVLEFFALREREGFTLHFEFPSADFVAGAYIASPQRGSADPEKLMAGADVVNHQGRAFMLPRSFRLADTDWKVTGAPNFDASDQAFKQLSDASLEKIGSDASPASLLLNPHWLYLKFLYFDRFSKQKLSIPPIMVEGFHNIDAPGAEPDTRSNWQTHPEACQCLPWILRKVATPESKRLLQFRTLADTYVHTTGSTGSFGHTLVTKRAGPDGAVDPGLNRGADSAVDFNVPNADRLSFYDLPPIWKSRTYFTRLSGGTGAAAAKEDLFENLAGESTTDAQPLLFSLDDIVLMQADAAGNVTSPLSWNTSTDRLAIFCNTFRQQDAAGTIDATNLTTLGLYKRDANAPFLSQQVQMTASRTDNIAYIGDYPDWPRLVIAQGNVFDVFDKRTPDAATGVVGARAGVRYLDVFSSPTTFVAPGTNRPALPNPRQTPFCTVHPLFELRNFRGTHVNAPNDQGVGRFDLLLLRCCNVNGSVEEAVALNYFRLFFNYSGITSGTLSTAAGQRQFTNSSVENIAIRWNGRDPAAGNYNGIVANPDRALIQPQAAPQNLSVAVLWFAQATPQNISHFRMDVLAAGRAFMGSQRGIGQLGQFDNAPFLTAANPPNPGFPIGSFTNGHEAGHGGGLSDEYLESSFSASYFQNGVYSNIDGGPYLLDRPSLMCNSMIQLSPRHYWHIAEWLFVQLGLDCQVVHNGFTYRIPHHPRVQPAAASRSPSYSFINFSVRSVQVSSPAPSRRACDLFVHPLGNEPYSTQRLVPGSAAFDGVLSVLVKMRFTLHTNTHATILQILRQINASINTGFTANRFVAAGTVNGVTVNRCLLVFQPRYLVNTFSGNANYAQRVGVANTNAAYQARVNQIASNHTVPFNVTTRTSGGSTWTAQRNLTFDITGVANFWQFFAQMLGLNPANLNSAATYVPLVRQIIPAATVQAA